MGSEDLAEYAVVSSKLLLYRVEPVRVVRLCLRVGFSRLMRRPICCCCCSVLTPKMKFYNARFKTCPAIRAGKDCPYSHAMQDE